MAPHENDWIERSLDTAKYRGHKCDTLTYEQSQNPFTQRGPNWECTPDDWSFVREADSEVDWDGWLIYGPITFGLLAGLYLTIGSLSLRLQRQREAAQ